jgi:hypothetical protein
VVTISLQEQHSLRSIFIMFLPRRWSPTFYGIWRFIIVFTEPITGPYNEPVESSAHSHTLLFTTRRIVLVPKRFLLFMFLAKIRINFSYVPCVENQPSMDPILSHLNLSHILIVYLRPILILFSCLRRFFFPFCTVHWFFFVRNGRDLMKVVNCSNKICLKCLRDLRFSQRW